MTTLAEIEAHNARSETLRRLHIKAIELKRGGKPYSEAVRLAIEQEQDPVDKGMRAALEQYGKIKVNPFAMIGYWLSLNAVWIAAAVAGIFTLVLMNNAPTGADAVTYLFGAPVVFIGLYALLDTLSS